MEILEKSTAISANDETAVCATCWKPMAKCKCDVEQAKAPITSLLATDEALEKLREKLIGASQHSCKWRNLNISQAAEIEALEDHIRKLSWQLELERSKRDLNKTKRRIKKLKKKLSRGV